MPFKHMFNSKDDLTIINSKRTFDHTNEDNDGDDDDPCFLKKIRVDEEEEHNLLSDEYESEDEN